MNFFYKRFRAFVALILVTFVCLVTAYAVDFRMVGSNTSFTYDNVTYTFRPHINYSSGGAVYGGASAYSSKPLQGGNMGVIAWIYDSNGDVVKISDIMYNPNNNSSVTSTTDYVTARGTYYCDAMIQVYDSSTGDYIRRYSDSYVGPLTIPKSSATASSSETYDRLMRKNKEWLDSLEAERRDEAAERARQNVERLLSDNSGDLRRKEKERMAQEKAAIETEISELSRKAAERARQDKVE